MAEKVNINLVVINEAIEALDISFNTSKWCKKVGLDLAANQLEIVDEVCKPESSNIVVLGSRSGGKTYSVGVAAVRICSMIPRYTVLVFGPRSGQARRIVQEIYKLCKGSYLKDDVDWSKSSMNKVLFLNGSEIEALSANEQTENEGWHGDMAIIDECHRVSDLSFRSRIAPMLKSAVNPKYVKIGISSGSNHFKESFSSPNWKKLIYPWEKCPILYRGPLVNIEGHKYPKAVIDDMPLSFKKERFPTAYEFHTPSAAGMNEEDFSVQYECKWVTTINTFLNSQDQEKIVGDHDLLDRGIDGEDYFYGLDIAGGSEVSDKRHDSTSLAVCRRKLDGLKEVVAVYKWDGDIIEQIEQIVPIIHPEFGLFKCKCGCADYGSVGAAVVDYMKKLNLPIVGIKYKTTDSNSGKNYKNIMFDNLLFELRKNKLKYPKHEICLKNQLLAQHLSEWFVLERRRGTGANDSISAPSSGGFHDDTCNSLALAVYAADKALEDFESISPVSIQIPGLNISSNTVYSRPAQTRRFI